MISVSFLFKPTFEMATSKVNYITANNLSFSDSDDECIMRLLKPELPKPTLKRPKELEIWLLSHLFPKCSEHKKVKNTNIIEMDDDLILEKFIKEYGT